MNTFRVILKELRHTRQDWTANSLMILFPIVLMALLGTALSGAFSGSVDVEARVLYSVDSSGALATAFEGLRPDMERLGVRIESASDAQGAVVAVQEAEATAYVAISGETMRLTTSSRSSSEAELIRFVLSAFVGRYNTARAVLSVESASPTRVTASDEILVRSTSIEWDRKPRAIDYYSVTMLTFIIMYSSLFGMLSIRKERTLRTQNRILCAPVQRWQLLVGKVVGSVAVTVLQIAVVMLFSRYVLRGYWGNDLATVALILLAQAVMAVAIGVGVAYLIPSEGAAIGLINAVIPVLAWFAGSYVPLDLLDPALNAVGRFVPVSWVNRAILGIIYGGDYSAVLPAIAGCCGVAAALLVPAAFLARREAV